MRMSPYLIVLAAAAAAPASSRESLGVFDQWGAFRDPGMGRCYAISVPRKGQGARDLVPFVTVGTWPARGVRGQFYARLSRRLANDPAIALSVGGQRFALTGSGGDAWAVDTAADAAIVAAMRSARSLTISARDARGRRFSDRYTLDSAATAMDAASVGCARARR